MRREDKQSKRQERERERDVIENNAFHISSINKFLWILIMKVLLIDQKTFMFVNTMMTIL